MTPSKPTGGANPVKLRISTHSPVDLTVTDARGNESGVVPIPGTDFAGIARGIVGGSVQVLDDEEYVTVPLSGTYRIAADGYATGTASVQIETVQPDGSATTTALFSSLPTTASSTVALTVTNGAASSAAVDENGDGTPDFTAASSAPGADPLAYTQSIRTAVDTLGLPRIVEIPLDLLLDGIVRALMPKCLPALRGVPHCVNTPARAVTLQVNAVETYVNAQLRLAAHLPARSLLQGITTDQAQIILGMMEQLKSLL
jgi:hypothetical protein